MNPLALKALAGVGLLLAAALGGYQVADWRMAAQINAEAATAARTALSDYSDMVKDRDRLAGLLAASNDSNLKALKEAQDENVRLRDLDRARSLQLRIAATCPASSTAGTAASAGVDSGAGAELAPDARQAYFALRDGITVTQAQLTACQKELTLRAQPLGRQ